MDKNRLFTIKWEVMLKDLGHFPHQSAQLKGISLACGIIQNWDSEQKNLDVPALLHNPNITSQ